MIRRVFNTVIGSSLFLYASCTALNNDPDQFREAREQQVEDYFETLGASVVHAHEIEMNRSSGRGKALLSGAGMVDICVVDTELDPNFPNTVTVTNMNDCEISTRT